MQKYSFFFPWGPSSSRSFLKSRLNFVKYCFFFEPFSGYEPHLTKKLEISGWSVRFYRILIWQIVFCGLFLCLWGSRFGGQRCSYNNFSSYFKSRLVIQNYYFHHIFNNKQRHSFIHFFRIHSQCLQFEPGWVYVGKKEGRIYNLQRNKNWINLIEGM